MSSASKNADSVAPSRTSGILGMVPARQWRAIHCRLSRLLATYAVSRMIITESATRFASSRGSEQYRTLLPLILP